MKYIKNPIVIEAIQFTAEKINGKFPKDVIVNWINEGSNDDNLIAYHEDDGDYIYIHTLEGNMKARLGDYIIKGIAGEFYPCKPEIFKATYQMVEETD